jgi:hypothetical protein
MANVEEEFQDVLQNLEFALVQVYRAHEEMTDWQAETAVSSLIRTYTAEERGRKAPNLRLKPGEAEAYDSVQAMCELCLGRSQLENETGEEMGLLREPIAVSDLVLCLKRIRKSIQQWRKEGGRRGYFEFVRDFLLGNPS